MTLVGLAVVILSFAGMQIGRAGGWVRMRSPSVRRLPPSAGPAESRYVGSGSKSLQRATAGGAALERFGWSWLHSMPRPQRGGGGWKRADVVRQDAAQRLQRQQELAKEGLAGHANASAGGQWSRSPEHPRAGIAEGSSSVNGTGSGLMQTPLRSAGPPAESGHLGGPEVAEASDGEGSMAHEGGASAPRTPVHGREQSTGVRRAGAPPRAVANGDGASSWSEYPAAEVVEAGGDAGAGDRGAGTWSAEEQGGKQHDAAADQAVAARADNCSNASGPGDRWALRGGAVHGPLVMAIRGSVHAGEGRSRQRSGSEVVNATVRSASSATTGREMPPGEKSRLPPELSRNERKGRLPEDNASAAGFDWRAYLEYYPDLKQSGIDTEDKAWEHYQSSGRREHRITSRVRTVIRYLACDGLMNQLYSHISALAIAKSMHADVVLPPAAQRSSFGDSNTIEAGSQATVQWEPAPLEGLLDVHFLMDYWHRRGMNISQPPKDLPVPTLRRHEAAAWDNIPLPGIDPMLRFQGLGTLPSRRSVELADVVAVLRREMAEHVSAVVSEHPDRTIDTILIDLPHLLFLITTERVMPLVTEIARTLQFAPRLVRLAEAVLEGMRLQHGALYFNGLHLRIEEDAVDWFTALGGRDGVWKRYEKAMRASGSFDRGTAVYVASGLLTYDSGSKFNEYSRKLQKKQLAKQVFVKEMFLRPSDLDPLTSEEKAAVDFMVLVKSEHFVGINISTFSYYVREYRSLDGIDTATTTFIDTSEFGPNALFEISARVI